MNRHQLEAKVHAINLANRAADSLYTKLVEIVNGFVGLQILKVNGDFTKKFEDALKGTMNSAGSLAYYRYNSKYSLCFVVKSDVQAGEVTVYHETIVTIGYLDNTTVLKSIVEPQQRRCDYTLDEVLALLDARDKAKAAFETAQANCGMFAAY